MDKEQSTSEKALAILIAIMAFVGAILGIIILHTVIEGFVVMKLWNWLIHPLSDLIPTINMVHGMGITLFTSILITKPKAKAKDKEERSSMMLSHMFLNPILHLSIGYIVSRLY